MTTYFSSGYNNGADETEAPGSSFYITKEGGIDYEIVLLAVHCVFKRDSNICTLRVLETGLNICELLLDLGVLKLSEHAHTLAMGIVKRALLHLGCPHGCNDGEYPAFHRHAMTKKHISTYRQPRATC